MLIASFRSSLFMDGPLAESFKFIFACQNNERGMEAAGDPHVSIRLPFSVLHYGIGLGLGRGATWQISGAQGGSGGVGIRNPLPWVEAEPPDMQAPVNVSRKR